MKDNLYFSIIIANFNYGDMLGSAIESILHQDCKDYEIIIVDGGSTDNSVEVIKQYESQISWWVSEPDNGQSNAFNKGFSRAKGRFLTWLNADDIMLPGTLSAVKSALERNPQADYATGNFVRFLDGSCTISDAPWGPHYLPKWLQGPGRFNPIYGPTTFWSRSAYEAVGPIDESLHYTMDVDYWARLTMAGYLQVRVNHFCWGFRMHCDSKTAEYGDHERDTKVKEIMRKETAYIQEKTGYSPTVFWRRVGYFMRVADGSALRLVYNRFFIKGRILQDHFKIDYNI